METKEKPNKLGSELEYLIVFITENALKISTKNHEIIFTHSFNFNVLQVDLLFFAEGKY